jgi:hypothetical protein
MKQGSTLLLKGVIVVIGLAVLAVYIFGLPRVIGTVNMGGYDPILMGMYIPGVPFFIALYQGIKLLNNIDESKAFSESSVQALKNIKYCGILISAWYVAGLPYIFIVADKDDAPGVVAIALIIIFVSAVVAIFAALLQKLFQNAVDIKSENDLTV